MLNFLLIVQFRPSMFEVRQNGKYQSPNWITNKKSREQKDHGGQWLG